MRRRSIGVLGGLVGMTLVVGLLVALPTWATPPASWSPSSVDEVVIAGETRTVAVELTAEELMEDVMVTFEGEGLTEVVSASPTFLGDLEVGDTRVVTLTFAPGAELEPASVLGELKLRQSGPPNTAYPHHLPINVHVRWPEFQSPDGAYTLEYPPQLQATYYSAWALLELALPPMAPTDSDPAVIYVSSEPNLEHLEVEDYFDGSPGIDLFGQSYGVAATRLVDGHLAYILTPIVTLAGDTIVVVALADQYLVIRDAGDSFQGAGLDEILNSFSF